MSFGALRARASPPRRPRSTQLQPVDSGENSIIYAADGSRLGYIQSDEARTPVPIDKIPEDLQDATVAIEDERFYEHNGVDLEGVARAGGREHRGRRGQAGRLDDHDAARPQPLHRRPRARPRAEDQGGEARRGARGRALQGVDPRAVPELRLLRDRQRPHRGRGRGRRPDLLLQARRGPRPGRVGDARRPAAVPLAVQPAPERPRGARAPQRGPRRDGRAGLHLRRGGRRREGRADRPRPRQPLQPRSASPTSSTSSSSS